MNVALGPNAHRTLLAVVAAVVACAFAAAWDQRRDAEEALAHLADDQVVVARSLANELSAHLEVQRREAERLVSDVRTPLPPGAVRRRADAVPTAVDTRHLRVSAAAKGAVVDLVVPVGSLVNMTSFTRAGAEAVVLLLPDDSSFQTVDGRRIPGAPLVHALAQGSSTELSPEQATTLGLPPRIAVAGLASLDVADLGRIVLGYVVSAERLRERQERAQLRLLVGFLGCSGLILSFGLLAFRRQLRAVGLAHDLDVLAREHEHERHLQRVTRAATLGTFAMGIAHELTTPMNVLRRCAEQLLSKAPVDERATLRKLVEQVDDILGVIDGFRRLARGDAPSTISAPVSTVVADAIALVRHRFNGAGVSLVTAASPANVMIACDVRLIEHALVNLLLNACSACEAGGVVVVSIAVVDGDVEVAVTDDGRGIDADDVARVTDPFFTTKGSSGGDGLGLAIATEIVRAHRGRIRLAPHAPRGTVATIVLPAEAEATRATERT